MSKSILRAEKRSERGVTILLWTVTLPVLVSLMGLGVDASVMYAVKARLQLASDGASLAAARSLTLGATTEAQADAASANATRWFRMNYGQGYFGSSNVSDPTVVVSDDAGNTSVRNVQVIASVDAPTYFMRFWAIDGTRLRSTSKASRRDVVAMMVLDRSGSMGSAASSGTPCYNMKKGAKLFTGSFANMRDQIGMITYNDTAYLASAPVANFEPVLGFDEGAYGRVGNGEIDNITCASWTGSPQAFAYGYNEIFKKQLPGALNVVVFFTDGIPNTLTFDFSSKVGVSAFEPTSKCRDSAGVRIVNGGDFLANPPQWFGGKDWGANSWLANIPNGPIGSITNETTTYEGIKTFLTTSYNGASSRYPSSTGCYFANEYPNDYRYDLATYPAVDVYRNKLVNVRSGSPDLMAVGTTTVGGEVRVNEDSVYEGANNATWSAGENARASRNISTGAAGCAAPSNCIATTVYAIGFGSVNHELMLATSNDNNTYVGTTLYTNSRFDSTSVKGEYVWTNTPTSLPAEFKKIAAMILRLSN